MGTHPSPQHTHSHTHAHAHTHTLSHTACSASCYPPPPQPYFVSELGMGGWVMELGLNFPWNANPCSSPLPEFLPFLPSNQRGWGLPVISWSQLPPFESRKRHGSTLPGPRGGGNAVNQNHNSISDPGAAEEMKDNLPRSFGGDRYGDAPGRVISSFNWQAKRTTYKCLLLLLGLTWLSRVDRTWSKFTSEFSKTSCPLGYPARFQHSPSPQSYFWFLAPSLCHLFLSSSPCGLSPTEIRMNTKEW